MTARKGTTTAGSTRAVNITEKIVSWSGSIPVSPMSSVLPTMYTRKIRLNTAASLGFLSSPYFQPMIWVTSNERASAISVAAPDAQGLQGDRAHEDDRDRRDGAEPHPHYRYDAVGADHLPGPTLFPATRGVEEQQVGRDDGPQDARRYVEVVDGAPATDAGKHHPFGGRVPRGSQRERSDQEAQRHEAQDARPVLDEGETPPPEQEPQRQGHCSRPDLERDACQEVEGEGRPADLGRQEQEVRYELRGEGK